VSNRRRPRPRDVARRDQAVAAARDMAAQPGTAACVVDYAPPGAQCSWCDCPSPLDDPTSPHLNPAYTCGGCPEAAERVVRAMRGSVREIAAPVCTRHQADAYAVRAMGGGPRTEVVVMPPWESPEAR
jgi:hypothetical protein